MVVAMKGLFAAALCLIGASAALAQTPAAAQARSLRDPTVPVLTGAAPDNAAGMASDNGLSGVLQVQGKPFALMDGQVLKVGQMTSLGRITGITADAVYVRNEGGKTERVSLYPAVNMQSVGDTAASPRDSGKGGKK